jgi:hypothetical protein
MEIDLAKRYQSMLVLWFALLMSVALYFVFSLLAPSGISHDANSPPNAILILSLTGLGALFVIVSCAVKKKVLNRSVEKQDTAFVQKALVIACAMCEVSALLGLLEHFVIGNREYYLLFVFAAVGMALHFPRRSDLEAASYKSRSIVH